MKFFSENLIELGCDEAGRGCLAGPVFAAAVILPRNFNHYLLNDSKKLSEKNRLLLRDFIINNALAWAVAMVDNKTIDQINILNASIKAMNLAISQINLLPDLILVDGNRFYTDLNIPFKTIIDGDAKINSIAAASILAKTFRDEYMCNLHDSYPFYNWKKNKGYPTPEHKKAIEIYGLSPYHRISFCSDYLTPKIF